MIADIKQEGGAYFITMVKGDADFVLIRSSFF
jgi:hypothetical protein